LVSFRSFAASQAIHKQHEHFPFTRRVKKEIEKVPVYCLICALEKKRSEGLKTSYFE